MQLRAGIVSALKRSLAALLESAKEGLGEPLTEELALIASVDERRRVAPHLFAVNYQLRRSLESQDVERVEATLRHMRELSSLSLYREALYVGPDPRDPWESFLLEELHETWARQGSHLLSLELSEQELEQVRSSIHRALQTLERANGCEAEILLAEVVLLRATTGGTCDSRLYGRVCIGLDPGDMEATEYFVEQLAKAASWLRLSAVEMQGVRFVESLPPTQGSPETPLTRELLAQGLALAQLILLEQALAARPLAAGSPARLQRHEERFSLLFDELARRQDLTPEGRAAVMALWEKVCEEPDTARPPA